MSKNLIVLSGNVAVGKSTIGPYLAHELNAAWLSESALSEQFSHLFADDRKESRRIAQLAFATLRTATILSTFLSGVDCVVAERGPWDNWLFFEMWRDRFNLADDEPFFVQLRSYLASHSVTYTTHTVWLKCPLEILLKRVAARFKTYDHIHTKTLLSELEHRYETAFRERPPESLLIRDVSDLKLSKSSIQQFVSEIRSALPTLV